MKVRIKTFYGELHEYLTEGKVYDATKGYVSGVINIVNDQGYESMLREESCFHLNGGSWEIVNEN